MSGCTYITHSKVYIHSGCINPDLAMDGSSRKNSSTLCLRAARKIKKAREAECSSSLMRLSKIKENGCGQTSNRIVVGGEDICGDYIFALRRQCRSRKGKREGGKIRVEFEQAGKPACEL